MLLHIVNIIFITIVAVNGERAKDQMYENLNGNYACFRRLNATHQIGCSSSRKGSAGVVHFVTKPTDLRFILANGTAPPYVPVMPISLLKPSTVRDMIESDKVSGVILYNAANETREGYSHEDSCPNRNYNSNSTCAQNKWNLAGTGLLREDIPFPMFYLDTDEDVQAVKDCFGKFNNFSYDSHNVRPLCSIELSSFMFGTTDTPTCLRRSQVKVNFNPPKFCDPVGDQNVWSTLFPIANISNETVPSSMKYVVVAARLDSTSLFHEKVPGVVSPVTGLVTLLTTAHVLKQMLPKYENEDKNVLFMLFNGESYDYIGSQRVVYDMENGAFPTVSELVPPIKLEDISLLVELNQLSQTNTIFAYLLREQAEARNFVTNFKKNARSGDFVFDFNETVALIPPSSLQSFARAKADIPGIVVTDHGSAYKNRFYNSMFDDADSINYRYYPLNETAKIPKDSVQYHIANVSNVLARTIYQEIKRREYRDSVAANVTIVNELLNCYIFNANCTIHNAIQRKAFSEDAMQLYVGVSTVHNYITHLVGLALAWLSGDQFSQSSCSADLKSPMYRYFNMSRSLDDLDSTVCYRTVINFTEAVSPAFIIDDYDWLSNKYSSWSESTWSGFGLRLFLKPSSAHENMTIAIGSLVLVFSFALVYFVKSRSHILFSPPVADITPTRC